MAGDVVRLFPQEEWQTGEARPEKEAETRLIRAWETGTDHPHTGGPSLTVDDIYPDKSTISKDLLTALELLSEATSTLNEAIDHARSERHVQADDFVQQVQVLLPELFFCRSLGDGFGAIINALFHGLQNRAGEPLTEKQMLAFRSTLIALRNEPFIRFENAVGRIRELQSLFLDVMPSGMSMLDRAIEDLDDSHSAREVDD